MPTPPAPDSPKKAEKADPELAVDAAERAAEAFDAR
jgi:hypothetical protein